ncbi:ferric iron uptake transcriptional regulator [Acidithiobacillus acidisediminis]|jgi:Fur family ferric uptake transcriptional regulator|uniref:ferric iron uptake transcriptional regulator n=1 Tax=Acidithiobacillus TaxID=119977 RepID=UPI00200E0659|nr:ferric iron uptake transcriptional regulator [Acidithiobacillus sp. S30A2]
MNSEELKRAGLKATLPRLRILQILEASDTRHLTAEEVYRQLLDAGEEVGLATVYRVMTQFEMAGLVRRHHFEGDRAVFELNESGHHDHMVCTACGKVLEFYDQTLETRQLQIAAERGFHITDHSLSLYGTCKGMQERGVCSLEGQGS